MLQCSVVGLRSHEKPDNPWWRAYLSAAERDAVRYGVRVRVGAERVLRVLQQSGKLVLVLEAQVCCRQYDRFGGRRLAAVVCAHVVPLPATRAFPALSHRLVVLATALRLEAVVQLLLGDWSSLWRGGRGLGHGGVREARGGSGAGDQLRAIGRLRGRGDLVVMAIRVRDGIIDEGWIREVRVGEV